MREVTITGGSYVQMPLTNSAAVGHSLSWKQSSSISSSQLLKHREPYPPYAINHKAQWNLPKTYTVGDLGKGGKVGPLNPHRGKAYFSPEQPHSTNVSDHAPYRSRLHDHSMFEHNPVPSQPLPGYDSLHDPHLEDYFVRKFSNINARHKLNESHWGTRGGSTRGRTGGIRHSDFKDAVYKVRVHTGDKKGAGTDAKVYVRILGTKGKLPKKQLIKKLTHSKNKKKGHFKFTKGSSHVFKFDAKDIGDVTSITLEHDGLTKEESWYVDQLEIVKLIPKTGREKVWVFNVQQWFSLHVGDCQNSRVLYPKVGSKTEYEIVVVTGNTKGAGTDANISMTLFGKSGQTARLPLKSNKKSAFERGTTDVFNIKTNCVGQMTKLRIQHDNTGLAPGWFLDRIVVTDLKHPRWKYFFPCGLWLAKDEGDGLIIRDLMGSTDPLAARKANKYKVTVYTGDVRGAGTDANVFCTLFGDLGESGEHKLDTSKNNFERNTVDEFYVECAAVGRLKRLRIGHDNTGPGPGWFLDKIIVDDMEANRVYEFPCGRWLAQDEDDGQISRDLLPGVGPGEAPPGVPYTIECTTGSRANAGTSARVFVIMYGGKDGNANSGKVWLTGGDFKRARTDVFNVEVADMLSPLSRIDIGHDNSGAGAGWFLDQVKVTCPSAGLEQTFRCDRWLALDEDDGAIERTLYETARKDKKKSNTWHIVVHTSDINLAGTDANVILTAYGRTKDGEYRKSDDIKLDNKGDNFEQGKKDSFKVQMDEIGKPYKIRIGHDNSKPFAGWHLNRVEMTNMATHKMYTFRCNRWLAEDEEDHEIVRELPAEGEDIKKPQPLVHYAVSVHTGTKSGAGTDANVFINVFGEQGDTGERRLHTSKTNFNKFENGNVDEFLVEAVTLKKLKKIRIGHDGENPGAGWFLDKVVVRQTDNPDYDTTFECNRWLDLKEDDGLLVREITAGGSQMLSTTTYQVSVKTGDRFGAGTDADVFLKVFGKTGDTGSQALVSSEHTSNKFERGRTDQFKIEMSDIGQIEKIRIGHNGSKPGSGWFLDEVRIDVPSKGERYIFACHRWLDTKEEDGQIEIEMEPTAVEKGSAKIPYEMTVWTGDVRGAGTDANVFVQMYGEYGKTEEFPLRNRTDNFEQAQVDKFKVEATDVGPLLKVRIGHNGKGAFAGWYLDKLLVQRHPTKMSKRRKPVRREASAPVTRSKSSAGLVASDSDDDRRRKGRSSSAFGRRSITPDGGRGRFRDVFYESDDDKKKKKKKQRGRDWSHSDSDDDKKKKKKKQKGRDWSLSDSEDDRKKKKPKKKQKGYRDHSSDSDYDKKKKKLKKKGKHASDSDDSDLDLKYKRKTKGLFGSGKFELSDSDNDKKRKKKRRGYHLSDDDSDVDSRRRSVSGGRRMTRTGSRRFDDDDIDDRRRPSSANRKKSSNRKYDDDSDDGDRMRPRSGSRKFSRKDSKYRGDDDSDRDSSRKLKKYGRKYEEEGEEEVEDYWFVCKRWFAKSEDDGMIVRELLPTDENGIPLETGLKEVEYFVTVYTGDVWGAGTDANVFINIAGELGDTGERALSKSDHMNKWERNQEDKFSITAIELGKLRKVKIRHDNKGGGAAWFLGHVEIEDPKNRKSYFFPCQRWLAVNEDDGQIARDLVAVDKSLKKFDRKDSFAVRNQVALETKAAMQTYHVHVYTGDKRGAGTDANVYVTLYGEHDDTGVMFLKSSKTHRDKFERNQVDEFVLEVVDLGDLKKMKIGHDNAGLGGDWFLDRVEIDCPSLGRKWYFPATRWLAKGKADGQLEVELHPQHMATEEYEKCVPYEVTTYTSDKGSASTDADVYIVLYGAEMATSQKSLCSSKAERKSSFKKGAMDKFVIEAEDVGSTIEKIRIGHDNAGFGSAWHLEKVEVRRLKEEGKGSETYVFPCDRWLARDEEDGAIERELVASKVLEEIVKKDGTVKKRDRKLDSTLEAKKYVVNVYTGDVKGAGTDANVFCTMYGDRGDSGERKLVKSETNRDKFERNQLDIFNIEAVDLGKMYKMKIRHDNSMLGPAWFLDRVEVVDTADKETFVFHCERWLAKNKEDCKIERTLYVKGYDGPISSASTLRSHAFGGSVNSLDSLTSRDPFGKSPRLNRRQLHADEPTATGSAIPYTIKVVTGDEKDQGTEANAWVKIYGARNKHTGTLSLELAQKKGFEPGSIETFSLEAPDVKDVKSIEIGHDGMGQGAGWFVKEVEVDMPTKGKHFYFTCKQWLARDRGDGKTSRMFSLGDGDSQTVAYKPLVPYELTVYTGDKEGAGTDCQVFIKLFGNSGATSEVQLEKADVRFERGREDFMKVELDDVGPLKMLRLGHDGKGTRKDWYVDKVELRSVNTGDLTVFKVGGWMSATKDDRRLTRDVPALVRGKVQMKTTTYRVSVKTSDLRGAGTGANVFLVIFGQHGDSGELRLKDSENSSSPFDKAATDTFTFNNMLSLGQLMKCRVWHDDKGLGSAWHLAQIEIEDQALKQKFVFPCNRWLSKSDDDKQIVRELSCANAALPATGGRVSYEIEVMTSDKKDAGTVQNAWVVLEGTERASKEFLMENGARNKILRRGQTDSFTMTSKNLGSLQRCLVGAVQRDDKPVSRGDDRENEWHCHQVAVTNRTTGDKYIFPCKEWIEVARSVNKKYAKKLRVKDVEESMLTSLKSLGTVKYEVTVVTGDMKKAGTDANVQITIFGTHGDTGARPLTQRFRDLFERGQKDVFTIEAIDLGDLTKITMEHDNSGFGADWYLERVEITNQGTSRQWTFPCGQWLAKGKGDGQLKRELYARD